MAKILLVEDDTNLSEIYQARLEAEGYVVVAATDGETALALAAKEKPDLILSDVMMPKISGFEMLDILRNTDGLKHTKVIMLTALGQAEDRTRAEKLGADRYLVKSQVTLEDIVTAAQELLNQDGSASVLPASAQPTIPAAEAPATETPIAATPVQPAPTGPLESTPTTPTPVASTPVAAQQPEAPAPVAPPAVQPVVEMPAEEQPEPTPEPAAATEATAPGTVAAEPAFAPMPAPDAATPETVALSEPVVDGTQTTAQESAAVDDKIAGFAEQPAGPIPQLASEPTPEASVPAPEPTPALEPETPASAEATADAPAPADTLPTIGLAQSSTDPVNAKPAVAIDESVVASAIDKLLAKTPNSAGGSANNPAPTNLASSAVINPSSSSDKVPRKVISPPERSAAPSLQELLAKEEAKTSGTELPDQQNQQNPSAPGGGQAAADKPAVDPNSIAL